MKKLLSLAVLVVFITSCGGGGGGGGESAPSVPAPQNITVSLTSSADSAEVNSSITLTWSSTLATSCSASGSWSGSKATSGSESIIIGVGGINTFSLSCSASGANSGSASTTVNGLRYFDGKVFDGYIRGAEVFVDTNDNLTFDANEASVTTDNQGSFTQLLFENGTLVSKGGFDLDTGAELSDLTLVHKLDGYEASKLASPFTTLIAYVSDASTINAALGIDASIDLLSTDPIPNLGEGIYDQMYEKGNQLTVLAYTLQNHSNAVDSTSELYFQAIADQLEESYIASQDIVDIEDSTFISKVINKVEAARDVIFSSDVKANLNTVLSSTIPLLKVYADASTTSSVQRFAFSTLQNDVQDSTVMIGNASPTLLKYENNVFEYVATDQGIEESTINPISNNAPTISSSATFSAAENQTAIGFVTATDADGDSLTYSISGSEINISSSGVLTFVSAPDYETKTSYTATVTVSDGTDSVTQSIDVSVTDLDETIANEAPTISSSTSFSVPENNTAIGSVTATDADGDSLTYSISGSEINISSSGVLTFVSAPDYETKTSYTATVTVSDGTNSATQSITVTITDVDETSPNNAPTISSSATFSAAENQTAIGSVTATDADGDSLTYSISGSEINISSSGVLTFVSAPDYETKTSYTATVTVSDGTNSTTQNITVNVTDVDETVPNEAPTISSSAAFSLAENNTAIGSVTATDADGDSLTYSISGSEINISSSGVLTFVSAPDYETKTSYTATVTVSDGTASVTQSISINILNLNDNNPVISSSATFSLAENNTVIGLINSSDADGDSLTHSISGSEINISSSGVLSFAAAPDYETKNSYTATVTVSDGTNSATQSITVTITDVDETSPNNAPTISSSATFSAAENQTAIGSVTATDADGDSLTYSISGSEINISSSGVLSFAAAPDYETKNSYTATVTVSDGTAPVTQSITVNVSNENEAPYFYDMNQDWNNTYGDIKIAEIYENTIQNLFKIRAIDPDGDDLTFSLSGPGASFFNFIYESSPYSWLRNKEEFDFENTTSLSITVNVSDGTFSASEVLTLYILNENDNSPVISSSATFGAAENQTAIGSVTATDADGDSLTYSISGSEINISSSGVLSFATAPDYETKNSYTATVTVRDGINTNSTTQGITVNVTDVNENVAPTIGSSATFSAAENQTSIGSVTATDADGDSLTYSISGSEINISSSGVLSFAAAPDYETKNSYTATVTVSDGTASTTQNITVNVTDVNENVAPTISSSATFSAAENQTAIGSVTATDADGDSLTYSISGSEINISSSGVLSFATAPDYETKNSYTATVTVSDGTASTTQDITVNITDVVEAAPNAAPVISSSATFSAAENQTSIGSVTATDADGDSLTYSISGSEINISSSGVLSFATAPDYETKNSYTATVTVSDGTASTTQNITVNVTDVNENVAPTISSSATFSAAENQTAIGSVTATDADGDSLTYSISGSEINISSSGVLSFATAPDYETKNSYTATVTVSDGTASTTQGITVSITNIGGIYENGIAGAISTSWNKGVDFDKSGGNTFARVPEITNRYSIFSKSHSNSISTFQPWGTSITFKPDSASTNQRLIQISSEDFTAAGSGLQARVKDQGYLSIEGGAIKLRYRFLLDQTAAIGGTANVVQFTSNSILTAGNWYSLFIYFDGDNDQGGFGSSAFKIYLVNLNDGTLTDLSSNGTWVETLSINPSNYTFWNFEDYEIGSENFDGIIAAFSATTYKANELPSNDEIRTMALDPIKWLNDYKVNSTYRTVFNNNQDPIQSESGVFSLNSDEQSYATQVFLMGDGGTDTAATIFNQVHTGGSANLSLINNPSIENISIE